MSKIILNESSSAPSTHATGKCVITATTTKKIRVTDDQGVSTEFGPSPVFGLNYSAGNSFGLDTNTVNTFKIYLTISYSAGLSVPGNKYEIDFCSTIRNSTTGRNHINRIAIDGVTLEQNLQYELKDTGSDIREPIGYKFLIDGNQLNNAGGVITYEFRPQNNGDTARVYSSTLTFKRTL